MLLNFACEIIIISFLFFVKYNHTPAFFSYYDSRIILEKPRAAQKKISINFKTKKIVKGGRDRGGRPVPESLKILQGGKRHMFNNGCGCGNDIFLILILLCCCGGGKDCGCYDRKGCDCCDIIVWLLLLNCICGKNDCCCK